MLLLGWFGCYFRMLLASLYVIARIYSECRHGYVVARMCFKQAADKLFKIGKVFF